MATTLTTSQVSNLIAQAFGFMFLAYSLLQLALGCVEVINKSFQEAAVTLVVVGLKLWYIKTGLEGLRAADTVTPTRVGLITAFSYIYGVFIVFQIGFYSLALFIEQHHTAKTQMWVIYFLVILEFILFSGFAVSLNKYMSGLLAQLQNNENQESVAMVIPESKS